MKVACLQMNSNRDIAANAEKLRSLVKEAAGRGAQLVATPENTFVMGEPPKDEPRVFYTQETHPGVKASAELAREYRCWLLIGSVAVQTKESQARHPKKTYNRSLLFNPEGGIAAAYDKIHLFDVDLPGGETYTESSRILPGEKAVVAAAPGAKIGMTICYDVRFPNLYRTLAKAGADILAVPAAFTVPTGEAHWHVLLRARAIENGCFVIAPAQVGSHPGKRKTYGHALIVDPWGKVLAEAGTDEGVIMADLDMQQVSQARTRLPSLQHDRKFVI
jgi:predicted amidohydrolase